MRADLPATTGPREVVERFNAAFGDHDVPAALSLTTEDCVFEDTTPPYGVRHVGREAVRRSWEALFDGAPAARFHAEELFVAGDRVVVRWLYSWGDGEDERIRGVDLFTVRDGLVSEKAAYVKG